MMERRQEALSAALLALLGPAGLIALAEKRGGTRLFVPAGRTESLATLVGDAAAQKLAARYGGDYIRVPLARELRARHYRAQGASNAEIAIKLGITETGVNHLFRAMPNKPVKGSNDPRQGNLFQTS